MAHDLATIRDLRDGLSELVDRGHGDLPVLMLLVDDRTIKALDIDKTGDLVYQILKGPGIFMTSFKGMVKAMEGSERERKRKEKK